MFIVQPLSQRDDRWSKVILGIPDPASNPPSTLGTAGCLLTCLTMVANGFGVDITPDGMNQKMKDNDGFILDNLKWIVMTYIYPQIRFRKQIVCPQGSPKNELQAALSSGMPVIVEVNYNTDPDPARFMQHWILLVGLQGDDYLILDPYVWPTQKQPAPLSTSRYCPPGRPDPILNAIFLTGTPRVSSSDSLQSKTLPPNPLVGYTTDDSVALRSGPVIVAATLIDWMKIKTKLICLEPPAAAQQKMGQNNVWLEVQRDSDGQRGYVFAMYVAPSQDQTVDVTQPPVGNVPKGTEPTGLILYATDDDLAFRSQPILGEDYVIRRVPHNTQFSVLDPADQASQKIGQQGQWLNVKDIQGIVGYVAAWYVSTTPVNLPVPGNLATPPPVLNPSNSNQLIVQTTDDGVALRSQPVIASATLIKWMPNLSELIVLDPASDAENKVGVFNQWLHVRDINAAEGYVAAWYVTKAPLLTGAQ